MTDTWLNNLSYHFSTLFLFQRFFHETVDQNDHVMVRINTPYQQEPPQLFLKNASIPPIADLSFHSNTVLSNAGLPGKPTKDKSHNYTNRFVQFLYEITKMHCFFFINLRRHNLPESPPDSEPPYSPADGVGQSPRKMVLFNLIYNRMYLLPKTVAFTC